MIPRGFDHAVQRYRYWKAVGGGDRPGNCSWYASHPLPYHSVGHRQRKRFPPTPTIQVGQGEESRPLLYLASTKSMAGDETIFGTELQ